MPEIVFPEAYLLTFTTYGAWLHGDARGSIQRDAQGIPHQLLPNRGLQRWAQKQLQSAPLVLSSEARAQCTEAITEVCRYRGWRPLAINVRTNHVHVVVRASVPPEKVMTDFKAWCTRRLRETGAVGKAEAVWTPHGSTRYLYTSEAVIAACRYVVDEQGAQKGLTDRATLGLPR